MSNRNRAWSIGGAVLAAVTASVCCVGPLLLLGLGVSGAWIGTLMALEPLRPLFSILALAFLGFAFYRAYRTPGAEECAEGSHCARSGSRRFTRITLCGSESQPWRDSMVLAVHQTLRFSKLNDCLPTRDAVRTSGEPRNVGFGGLVC